MNSPPSAHSTTWPKSVKARRITGLSADALERPVADYFADFAWDPHAVEPAAMSTASFFQFLTRD